MTTCKFQNYIQIICSNYNLFFYIYLFISNSRWSIFWPVFRERSTQTLVKICFFFFTNFCIFHTFLYLKTCFFLGIKPSTRVMVFAPECWLKTMFCWILQQISCFFFLQLFSSKNNEKKYFDQRFKCTAPKPWSKYTTSRIWTPDLLSGKWDRRLLFYAALLHI